MCGGLLCDKVWQRVRQKNKGETLIKQRGRGQGAGDGPEATSMAEIAVLSLACGGSGS